MNLTDISRNQPNGSNGSGNKGYIYIALSDVYGRSETVETATDNVITAFQTSATFAKYEGDRSSVKWKVTSKGDPDSKNFDVEGEIFLPRITPSKSHQLGQSVNYPSTIICEDRNNNIRIIGEKDDGVSIDVEEMTEGKNGVLVKFKIEGLPALPRFIQDLSIIPLPS